MAGKIGAKSDETEQEEPGDAEQPEIFFREMPSADQEELVDMETSREITEDDPLQIQEFGTPVRPGQDLRASLDIFLEQFVCGECKKVFSNFTHFQFHARSHSGNNSYVCGICGKSFKLLAYLRKHSRVHSKDKPHRCECGKTYTNKISLKNHKMTHALAKNCLCDHCLLVK